MDNAALASRKSLSPVELSSRAEKAGDRGGVVFAIRFELEVLPGWSSALNPAAINWRLAFRRAASSPAFGSSCTCSWAVNRNSGASGLLPHSRAETRTSQPVEPDRGKREAVAQMTWRPNNSVRSTRAIGRSSKDVRVGSEQRQSQTRDPPGDGFIGLTWIMGHVRALNSARQIRRGPVDLSIGLNESRSSRSCQHSRLKCCGCIVLADRNLLSHEEFPLVPERPAMWAALTSARNNPPRPTSGPDRGVAGALGLAAAAGHALPPKVVLISRRESTAAAIRRTPASESCPR